MKYRISESRLRKIIHESVRRALMEAEGTDKAMLRQMIIDGLRAGAKVEVSGAQGKLWANVIVKNGPWRMVSYDNDVDYEITHVFYGRERSWDGPAEYPEIEGDINSISFTSGYFECYNEETKEIVDVPFDKEIEAAFGDNYDLDEESFEDALWSAVEYYDDLRQGDRDEYYDMQREERALGDY